MSPSPSYRTAAVRREPVGQFHPQESVREYHPPPWGKLGGTREPDEIVGRSEY